jgi:hypothetical protein
MEVEKIYSNNQLNIFLNPGIDGKHRRHEPI